MDSWSRPSKSQATPAPYYLTNPTEAKYCHTCGRIIGQRRAHTTKVGANNEVKYCSDRCKRNKPSTAPESVDVRIEKALQALLQGSDVPKECRGGQCEIDDGDDDPGSKAKSERKKRQPAKKGDQRIIVPLSEVEEAVFGNRHDPEKTYGRRKNRAFRGVKDEGEWKSVDMVDRPNPLLTTTSNDSGHLTDDSANAYDSYDSDGSTLSGGGVTVDPQAAPVAVSPSDNTFIPPSKPLPGSHIRAAQTDSELNFAAQGGERGWAEKINETPEMLAKRREGQKKAEERELVRCVARRAVVFGLQIDGVGEAEGEMDIGKGKKGGKKGRKGAADEEESLEMGKPARKKCEALMDGAVVEPSFAKGDWSIRWREEY